ncbi:MAG: quinone-dependent dihydroorotate dehydrogenase [Bacteroidetes bacterium]|nr:quinone-dependent dihydroorotate dehydrogenase [Bacteroidota bacterium]MBS1630650.1 quinone-dependent dihydroorotate dehydrogenase [Bacteroidota bacterium]
MYRLLRPLLFLQQPEAIHYRAMRALQQVCRFAAGRALLRRLFCLKHPTLERTLWGIRFPNPVGLGAGFDKDARWTNELACLGFGFVEIGTLTPRPQPGNPRPRLFRLPADQALINRMGFNNGGAEIAATRLRLAKKSKGPLIIIGGNIGKNKDTANEQATHDYEAAFRALQDVVDYFVVNVSSPNTPGLRALQDREPLTALLHALKKLNAEYAMPKPILLKIAPDLSEPQLDDIIAIVQETGIDGIVATNTTIGRSGLNTASREISDIGAGGLSGKPLRERATEVIRYIYKQSAGQIPMIAVGGIFSAEDALEKLQAGASLVQVYTGFIYEGPGIARKICKGILKADSSK